MDKMKAFLYLYIFMVVVGTIGASILACIESDTPIRLCPTIGIDCPDKDHYVIVCDDCTLIEKRNENGLTYIKVADCDSGDVVQTSFRDTCDLVIE